MVAEGVEDDDTWQALTELGVDEIQGWVVARAMPTAELAPWVAAHLAGPPRLRGLIPTTCRSGEDAAGVSS